MGGRVTVTLWGQAWERGEPSTHGQVDGINFNVVSFHSNKGNDGATQTKQRKAAPPEGDAGRRHRPKEE